MHYYSTEKVCAKQIGVTVDYDGYITEIEFVGGCDGNTHGLQNLLLGMKKEDAIAKLEGIDCRGRGTSCPDQLAKILKRL
ncbi:TIGR03905 family TSCPD domain-containing protein [Fusobacterium sp.]|jgi:uncharacterized protein (TIGR03905 family)|nr:TIGR03905 family TSCPD domain-containing protein [Fusobacterium sp.]MCF2638569.1 TIGR03905 family TSCPD domain-containing protein [Fusobacterium varium]MDY3058538.1 TIGR03905 family TSCPD domain-containing protein [Fusobacterium sp.]MEE1476398.1 TIGR03905 family TSCPD domain-containing protein [Fusobacterium sp.]